MIIFGSLRSITKWIKINRFRSKNDQKLLI